MIVLKDRRSKIVAAHTAPRKGVDPYVTGRVAQDIRNLGYRMIIIKSGQEPSILALKWKSEGTFKKK